jgi:hypothetical protein
VLAVQPRNHLPLLDDCQGRIDANSKLSFDYLRGVESFNGNYDITQVDILTDGGSNSTTVFSLNASDASSSTWKASGDIPLADFAGQVIQVRFRFNTVDNQANAFLGWFIDDVVVTAAPQDSINSGEWTQFAIPCAPVAGESSLATLLGDDVSGEYGKDCVVYRYNIADGYPRVALTERLEQGVGYWFIHNHPQGNAAIIDMPASCAVTPTVLF